VLGTDFDIPLTALHAFINMPIGRFRDYLLKSNALKKHVGILENTFNSEVLDGLMNRRMVSVG